MFGGAQSENVYALGHAHSEIERLTVQAHMFEPFTRQFFEEAGLRPGMRVLDVGSGAGDVAFPGCVSRGAKRGCVWHRPCGGSRGGCESQGTGTGCSKCEFLDRGSH